MLTIPVDDSAFRATQRSMRAGLSDVTPVMEHIGDTPQSMDRPAVSRGCPVSY